MKKLLFLFCVPLLIVACGKAPAEQASEGNKASEGNEVVEGYEAGKAVRYEFDEKRLRCCVVAETPEAPLREAVGEWLCEVLGGYYEGDVNDLQTMVDFYGHAMTDTLRKELVDIRPEAEVAFEATMEKAYETDVLVTYTYSTYYNLGGAHPTSSEEGATFRKSDGRRLTWDVIRRDRQYQFSQLLIEHLKDYFGMAENELMQVLGEQTYFNPPLPRTPPLFYENGMVFVYQQYEIGSYAMGMPGDTIAYERIAPLLTASARRLVGQ